MKSLVVSAILAVLTTSLIAYAGVTHFSTGSEIARAYFQIGGEITLFKIFNDVGIALVTSPLSVTVPIQAGGIMLAEGQAILFDDVSLLSLPNVARAGVAMNIIISPILFSSAAAIGVIGVIFVCCEWKPPWKRRLADYFRRFNLIGALARTVNEGFAFCREAVSGHFVAYGRGTIPQG